MSFKFIYIIGERPMPMISIFTKPNINTFNEKYKYKFGVYNEDYDHVWTIDAYLIYNKKTYEVVAYAFNKTSNFVWLFRFINKPLIILFDEKFVFKNQNFFKDYLDEFACDPN